MMTLKEKNMLGIIGGAVFYVIFMMMHRFMFESISHLITWSSIDEALCAFGAIGFGLVWCFGNWCNEEG